MNDLRERVAEELWQADSLRVVGTRRSVPWSEAGPAAHQQWKPLADAAIALVLEEAAKVCDDIESLKWKRWKEHYDMLDQGASDGAGDCAEAIREMIIGKKV